MCNILLVTNEPFFQEGFAGFVSRQGHPDYLVAGSVETLDAARAICRDLHVDIIIVDFGVASGRFVTLAALAADVSRIASVLVIGPPQSDDGLRGILATGVRNYIHKTSDGRTIVEAIEAEMAEEGPSHPGLLPARAFAPLARGGHQVSAREMMVLKRTAFGYSAKEIARELAISQKSVETYKARATAKLGLVSRSDIIRYALRSGWFTSLLDEGRGGPDGRPNGGDDQPPLRN